MNPYRVLASRPKHQNRSWCEALLSKGFEIIDLPAMSINAASLSQAEQAHFCEVLRQADHCVFVSQNAVNHTCDFLMRHGITPSEKVKLWAVGSKTLELVEARLLDLLAKEQRAGLLKERERFAYRSWAMNSDELIEQMSAFDLNKAKVVICRGKGGLPRLSLGLEEKGAHVNLCETYSREVPQELRLKAANLRLDSQRDIVSAFSGETLQALAEVQSAFKGSNLKSCHVLLPGERVAGIAKALGFKQILQARNAREHEMLATLLQHVEK